MEPVIDTKAGITDLLEHVLDRGVIVKLDLIISVAGIPLVGLSLHAALASIETLNEYGMFGDWDKSSRKVAAIEAAPAKVDWAIGENVVLEQFAMVRSEEGIMRTWRPGRAYLTDRRFLLVRSSPFEVLVSLDLGDIAGIGSFGYTETGVTSEVVCLADSSGGLVLVRTGEPELFQACLADLLRRHDVEVADLDPAELRAAFPGFSAESQLWHDSGSEGGWRSGWGAISDKSFTFWSDFERRRVVDVRLAALERVSVERRLLSAPLGEREVLSLVRSEDHQELIFVGKDVTQWSASIQRAISNDGKLNS